VVALFSRMILHVPIKQSDLILHNKCWELVLKCFELRTRHHKMLNVNALRSLKHYLPKDVMNFGRRSWAKIMKVWPSWLELWNNERQNIKYKTWRNNISKHINLFVYFHYTNLNIKTWHLITFIPSSWQKAIIQVPRASDYKIVWTVWGYCSSIYRHRA
jgi:hypothetical protein